MLCVLIWHFSVNIFCEFHSESICAPLLGLEPRYPSSTSARIVAAALNLVVAAALNE